MSRKVLLPCVKTYDIRGKVPSELNEDLAERLGRAYATFLGAKKVVVGRDVRESGPAIQAALTRGLIAAGCDVIDLGLIGTEVMYFGAFHLEDEGVDGGIVVTASHNPKGYNGMKMVRKSAIPLSGDSGLFDIERLAHENQFVDAATPGEQSTRDITSDYIDHLMSYVEVEKLKKLHIVSNAGNGAAGPFLDAVASRLPFTFEKLCNEPDGTFPNGVPNPLEEYNRAPTSKAVVAEKAAMGIAWDGDFDRCFFFDEKGDFIDGYYIVGLFAKLFLDGQPKNTAVIHDPRLTWNTTDIISQMGGRAVECKTGHAFIKERMRKEDAVYGGEMSAHHYFRRFAYCDSGMIPWLVMAQFLSENDKPLSAYLAEMKASYPVSGEINRRVDDADATIAVVEKKYGQGASISRLDGVSIAHPNWRMSLRKSNTEPVIRLNIETRGDEALLKKMTEEILADIGGRA